MLCFLLPKSNCGWTPFNRQSGTTLERTLSTPSNAPNPLELKLGKTNSAMLQALVGAAHGLPSRLACFERLVMMKIWRVVFILRAIRWNWTIATGNEAAYWEMTRIWCFREWLIYTAISESCKCILWPCVALTKEIRYIVSRVFIIHFSCNLFLDYLFSAY